MVTEEEYKQNLSNAFEMNNAADINQNIYTYIQCKLILQLSAAIGQGRDIITNAWRLSRYADRSS